MLLEGHPNSIAEVPANVKEEICNAEALLQCSDNVRLLTLKGTSEGRTAHVLVDSAATQTFISDSFVKDSNIAVKECNVMPIKIANGDTPTSLHKTKPLNF